MISDKIKIRIAKQVDLEPIIEIYNQAIRSRTATGFLEELKPENRKEWFQKFNPKNYPIFVATLDKKVIGFIFLSPYRSGRKAMQKIAEISFFVDYKFHGKGIGTVLFDHMMNYSKKIGKQYLIAFLLDVNIASIALLEKFNFEERGLLPDVIDFGDIKRSHLIYGRKLP